MKSVSKFLIAAAMAAVSLAANATPVTVQALANSSSGGTGVAVAVVNGATVTVTADAADIWNAGTLPRWSNAAGLVTNLTAPGTPDLTGDNPTGLPGSNLIGQPFSNWSQGGLSAPYGSLVGSYDGGTSYFFIGLAYTGVATSDTLRLYYFDENSGDNSGSIIANVNQASVPVPAGLSLVLAGLGALGFASKRRRQTV